MGVGGFGWHSYKYSCCVAQMKDRNKKRRNPDVSRWEKEWRGKVRIAFDGKKEEKVVNI